MLIDRKHFRADPDGTGYRGSFGIDGQTYEGYIGSWSGDMESSWANAEAIMRFLIERSSEIEQKVRADLVPELSHWSSERIGDEELTQRVLRGMKKTNPVKFVIYDRGASSIFFDGPDFVLGHDVEVQFGEGGRLGCVGLSG